MCSIPFSHDFYFSFKKYLQFMLLRDFLIYCIGIWRCFKLKLDSFKNQTNLISYFHNLIIRIYNTRIVKTVNLDRLD